MELPRDEVPDFTVWTPYGNKLENLEYMDATVDFKKRFDLLCFLYKEGNERFPYVLNTAVLVGKPEFFRRLLIQLQLLAEVFVNNFLKKVKWSYSDVSDVGQPSNESSSKIEEHDGGDLFGMVQDYYKKFLEMINYFLSSTPNNDVQQQLRATRLLLLQNCIFFEEQPPQILRNDKRFNLRVTFLEPLGNISNCAIYVLRQEHAQKLVDASLTNKEADISTVVNFNSLQSFEEFSPKNKLATYACFDQVTIKRTSVDVRSILYLLFVATGEVNQVPTKFWCISCPFMIINSVTQMYGASAALFWDSTFKHEQRLPSQGFDQVPWSQLASTLNFYLKRVTNTRWNLTPENLQYIGSKIFEQQDFKPSSMVSQTSFCVASSEGSEAKSIWKWLYEIMQLITKHLQQPWNSGAIIGFIDREKAEQLIQEQEVGTFLIRFSDSVLGGVSYTVAVPPTAEDLKRGHKCTVYSVVPLRESNGPKGASEQSLEFFSLNRRILFSNMFKDVLCYDPDLKCFQVFPKETKFFLENESIDTGPSGDTTTAKKRGYVLPKLITVIEPKSSIVEQNIPKRVKEESCTSPISLIPPLKKIKIETCPDNETEEKPATSSGNASVKETTELRCPKSEEDDAAPLWNKIKLLPEHLQVQIYRKYKAEGIPIQLRHLLAYWIEKKLMDSDGKIISFTQWVMTNRGGLGQFQIELLEEIRMEADQRKHSVHVYHKLLQMSQNLEKQGPSTLYQCLERCLTEELSILASFRDPTSDKGSILSSFKHLSTDELSTLASFQDTSAVELPSLKERWDQARLHLSKWRTLAKEMTAIESKLLKIKASTSDSEDFEDKGRILQSQNLHKELKEVRSECNDHAEFITQCLEVVVRTLRRKNGLLQQLKWSVCTSHRKTTAFIKDCCSLLFEAVRDFETLWNSRTYSRILENCEELATLGLEKGLLQRLNLLEETLLTSSLYFQDTPVPQVVDSQNELRVKVDVLFRDAPVTYNISEMVTVTFHLLDEDQTFKMFHSLQSPENLPNVSKREKDDQILNNKLTKHLKSLLNTFQTLMVKTTVHADERLQKKFILARTEFNLKGQRYQTWCCSSPIFHIVESHQRAEAWCSIFWETYFRTEGPILYDVEDQVPWSSVQLALTNFFSTMTKSTRSLNGDHLDYLGHKLFDGSPFTPDSLVGKNMLLQGFWDWFYAATDLVAKQIYLWEKGYIVGFMDRQSVESLLMTRYPVGYFVLLFRDSTPGEIHIVSTQVKYHKKGILSMYPNTDSSVLKEKSVVQQILDSRAFKTLVYRNDNDEWVTIELQTAFHSQSSSFPKSESVAPKSAIKDFDPQTELGSMEFFN